MKCSSKSKRKALKRGSLLIEIAAGFATLLIVSLLLLKAAVSVTTLQRWTVVQGFTDAFMSREVALGKRYPFGGGSGFLDAGTPWPAFPTVTTTADVVIGTLPGGQTVTGEMRRTRVPLATNLATAGGGGTMVTNPTGAEAWQLQSYLIYKIGGRDYVKSRTVFRAR